MCKIDVLQGTQLATLPTIAADLNDDAPIKKRAARVGAALDIT